MPELPTHEFATKVIFGAPFTQIHKLFDYPSNLYGKGHRVLYHDEESCRYLQSRFKDPRVYPVCKFHIFIDRHRDALKLETLVKLDQFDEAERLIRRIYSEAKVKWDPLSLENIQAKLEEDRRLVEEIRRLQKQIAGGTEDSGESCEEDPDDCCEFCRFMIMLSDDPAEKAEWTRKLEKIREMDRIMRS